LRSDVASVVQWMWEVRVLDLFSGIGGFSLGLERAGMQTVAFCEIEPFCRRVLAKHWPEVPCYDDIRTLTAERLAADGVVPDLICGGFPCQDISVAGEGAGLAGERSGLWRHYARLIGEIRPRFVIVENVAALLSRGLGDVLGDLAALGYDAEWHCIPASAVGACHRRDRIWILSHPRRVGQPQREISTGVEKRNRQARCAGGQQTDRLARHGEFGDVANADDAERGEQRWPVPILAELDPSECCGWWSTEPDVGRVAHGVPSRVDRIRGLGNAVVPQIPELIGRAIMQAEARNSST
jgi:DNA (cytosine-5)-methyltransferase 1